MNQNGRSLAALTLIALPFSLLASMIVAYIAMFGPQLPFEVKWKLSGPDNKLMNERELQDRRFVLLDSIETLTRQLEELKEKADQQQQVIQAWLDSVQTVKNQKQQLETQMASLKSQIDAYIAEKEKISQERIDRLAKIFRALDQGQLDSLYVASLDDQTILAIIDRARAQQAAAVFRNVEPRRAARLTSNYVHVRRQE